MLRLGAGGKAMSPVRAERDFLIEDDARLCDIFREARTIAVVGLSPDPRRPSHDVAAYLKGQGYRIIPVNPREERVLGEPAVPDLRAIPHPVDVVCLFRRSSEVGPHVDEAIAIAAKVLWLQDGVIDVGAARRAHDAGLKVVMDRCMLRDHARLWRASSKPF
jgi:predicted CoA-binding protein